MIVAIKTQDDHTVDLQNTMSSTLNCLDTFSDENNLLKSVFLWKDFLNNGLKFSFEYNLLILVNTNYLL